MGEEERSFFSEGQGRLDIKIREKFPELSRSFIQKLINQGKVFLNEKAVKKASVRVKEGDKIRILIPPPEEIKLEPEEGDIKILYEDEDIGVIFKPCNIVVHPSPGHKKGTLVNILLSKLSNLSSVGGKERPGIVHRLDKETSGLMVVAKNDKAHRSLSDQFKNRKTLKIYKVVVKGTVKEDHGIIDLPIGRHIRERKKFSIYTAKPREAITEFWVEERFTDATLLKVRIYTGRTHQIRVHLSHMGHPVIGDRLYGFKPSFLPEIKDVLEEGCIMLLSFKLGFFHPSRGNWMEFEAEYPPFFKKVIELLRKRGS